MRKKDGGLEPLLMPDADPLADGLAAGLGLLRGYVAGSADEARQIELARANFYEFIKQAWGVIDKDPYQDNSHIKVVADHLQAVLEGKFRKLIINVPPGFAKPVSEETPVLMADGQSKLLKAIEPGDSVVDRHGRASRVTDVSLQGELPCLNIVDGDGGSVVAAHDHPFLTVDGWVQAENLTKGQLLCKRRFGSDMEYAAIDKIEDAGLHRCRCISAIPGRSFCANGFVVSNSLITCVFWPAWIWLQQPHMRMLYVTYSQDFAFRDSNKTRDLVKSDWYQQRWGNIVKIRADRDLGEKFETTQGGFRQATSIEGGGTGARCEIIANDDLNKVEEANSKVARDNVNNIYDQLISGRGADPRTARFVIIQQRLHPLDISGYQLASGGGWVHLFLPMEFESARRCVTPIWQDPRTEDGDLLWPERFTRDIVDKWKAQLRGNGTAAQLQQRPEAAREGAIFNADHFRYFSVEMSPTGVEVFKFDRPINTECPKSRCRLFQVIDTATKLGNENAYTACGTFAMTPYGDLLVYDIARGRIPVPAQFDWIAAQRLAHPEIMYQAIEDRSSGIGLIQEAVLRGSPFKEIRGSLYQKDPVQKSVEAAIRYQSGTLWHRRGRPWIATLEGELCGYPYADISDCAIVVCYAASLARQDAVLCHAHDGDPLGAQPESLPIFDQLRSKRARGESALERHGLFGIGHDELAAPREGRRRMFR